MLLRNEGCAQLEFGNATVWNDKGTCGPSPPFWLWLCRGLSLGAPARRHPTPEPLKSVSEHWYIRNTSCYFSKWCAVMSMVGEVVHYDAQRSMYNETRQG